MKYACIAVLLLTSSTTTKATAFAQQHRDNSSSEPTTFIADEESFEPSVTIPPKVLAALVKTDAGKQGLEIASANRLVDYEIGSNSVISQTAGSFGKLRAGSSTALGAKKRSQRSSG